MEIEFVEPKNIEKRSFEIITEELKEVYDTVLDEEKSPLILRAIHTSADFSYAKTLYFSPDIPLAPQFLIMLVTVTILELFGLSLYAYAAGTIRRFLQEPRTGQIFNILIGLVMIASGVFAVLSTA